MSCSMFEFSMLIDSIGYKTRYCNLYGERVAPPPLRKTTSRMRNLYSGFTSDEDEPGLQAHKVDDLGPWVHGFNEFIDTVDEIPDDMSIVQWWGV